MNIAGLLLFIVFLLVALALFIFGICLSVKAVKSKGKQLAYEILFKKLLIYGCAFAISLMTSLLFIFLWNNIQAKWYEYLSASLGSAIFGFSFYLAITLFISHYYGKNIDEKLDKWFFRWMILGFVSSIIFFFVTLDGFADYINLAHPLANAISFKSGLAYPGEKGSIAFYAICILCGAILVYFYCDHKLYMEYGKHGLLESTFFVALPAGVIGARLFYVIGNWSSEFAGEAWYKPFEIWNGGLTILGGALTGIVVGVLWFMWRNKGYNIFIVVDIALPSILIAQTIGRWGNFFNCEVHGIAMSEEYWSWLPKIIFNNIHWGHDGGSSLVSSNQVYVPLFLIEGAFNLLGFFVIAHLFGRRLRKWTALGDLAFSYFIWYGLVRAIMEPLRDKEYIMDSFWSWFWSLAFIMVGTLAIILNHVIRNAIKAKKGTLHPKSSWFKSGLIGSIVMAFLGLACVVIAIVMIANSDQKLEVGFSLFNSALIILTFGVSFLGTLGISLPYMVRGLKARQECNA